MGYPLLVASKANGHNGPKVPGHKVRTGKVVASGLAGDDVVCIVHQMEKDSRLQYEQFLTPTKLECYLPTPIENVRAIRTGTSGSEVFVDVE